MLDGALDLAVRRLPKLLLIVAPFEVLNLLYHRFYSAHRSDHVLMWAAIVILQLPQLYAWMTACAYLAPYATGGTTRVRVAARAMLAKLLGSIAITCLGYVIATFVMVTIAVATAIPLFAINLAGSSLHGARVATITATLVVAGIAVVAMIAGFFAVRAVVVIAMLAYILEGSTVRQAISAGVTRVLHSKKRAVFVVRSAVFLLPIVVLLIAVQFGLDKMLGKTGHDAQTSIVSLCLVGAILTFGAAYDVKYYFDVRMRTEAFDLQHDAERIGGTAAV